MLTEQDILKKLDGYIEFINLNHPYVYLIDSRLNIFRNDNDQWCIVSEVLGYEPRGDSISLQMDTFGNHFLQYQESVSPIDWESFLASLDCEVLRPKAKYWLVRGTKVELSHKKKDYEKAGIELSEAEPGEIRAEEAARLIITKYQDLFRATDEELYQLVPHDMKKLLVLNEWHHREYVPINELQISDEIIRYYYDLGEQLNTGNNYGDFETYARQYKKEEQSKYDESVRQWGNTKPSSYETWQQIAKVIATGDASFYKPTLAPNTNWKFWPESGSL